MLKSPQIPEFALEDKTIVKVLNFSVNEGKWSKVGWGSSWWGMGGH